MSIRILFEVPIHLNKELNVLSDFDFVIIVQICNFSDHNSLEDRLLIRELFGVHNLPIFLLIVISNAL